MSYRNPKIYAADPLAFSQSFMQSFQNTFNAFQKVSEDIKKQRERDDLIQAELIKYTNIGDLEGVNTSVNNGIQQSINSMIDSAAFAKMTAVERQKVLNDVAKIKAGSEAFVQLYGIDLDELSNKSKLANPELDAILTQLKSDPNKVKISGDQTSLDVKFTTTTEDGKTYNVSLRDMSKYLPTYKSIADDEADWEKNIGADSKIIQALIEDDARKGIEGDLRAIRIAEHLNRKGTLDADTSSYLFYEKISDDKKGGVLEWHPTEDPEGNKLDEEVRKEIWAAQDKLIQDVYTEELEERIYTINVKPKDNDEDEDENLTGAEETAKLINNQLLVINNKFKPTQIDKSGPGGPYPAGKTPSRIKDVEGLIKSYNRILNMAKSAIQKDPEDGKYYIYRTGESYGGELSKMQVNIFNLEELRQAALSTIVGKAGIKYYNTSGLPKNK
jgi:stress-induced morphogen